ncbi:hypothetical protein [Fodinicurvata sp. EGI_FJ10296]|uniref:hypothetical protein n=1 Tax=Fodinicurvata sp. EGI_FJ10296 TaxID=3231908 RepID=UPI003454E326
MGLSFKKQLVQGLDGYFYSSKDKNGANTVFSGYFRCLGGEGEKIKKLQKRDAAGSGDFKIKRENRFLQRVQIQIADPQGAASRRSAPENRRF